ncbi:hypothetical protein EGO51_11315 [Haloarcula hispanica]|uniref:WbqC-like family protein n=1 Tax=Haloarcula hispanica TaxID=51589 RepID=A0A5J5LLM6_HALHI|nr:WbqC family protein [Haloarcula hispanica]KAA9410365.1 hypothetical protein EGO51_11315 [Haloarcula hispanica]
MTGSLVVWQPVYYPNLHFLARLNQAEEFVIFDTAEFSRQSRQHRAPIKFGGKKWLTIPILHDSDHEAITEAKLDMSQKWPKKHLKTIKSKYGGNAPAPFGEIYNELDEGSTLPDITVPLIRELIDLFEIDIKMYSASELDVPYTKGEPSNYLARLTEELGHTTYLCGQRAYENYLDQEPFKQRGIDIEIQNWEPDWKDGNVICLDVLYEAESPATHI